MNENGTNTSSEIPPRTIEVIRSERGDNYPQKHRDTIRHPRDREDFLVAAYAMIIASRLGKSTLERLLTAGGYANRHTMITNIKGRGNQLGLMGIFKKIIAFDNKPVEILVLNEGDLMRLLLEIQAKFAPETIRKLPTAPRESLPAETHKPDSRGLLSLTVTNPRVLAILDELPQPAIPSNPPPTHSTNGEGPKMPPVPERIQKIVLPAKPATPPPVQTTFPSRPPVQRREFVPRRQPPGRPKFSQPFIPRHLHKSSLPLKQPSPIAPSAATLSTPRFSEKGEMIAFLRGNAHWSTYYQHILHSCRDDLSIMAYLRPVCAELLLILSDAKTQFGYKNIGEIVREISEPSGPTVPPTIPEDEKTQIVPPEEENTHPVQPANEPAKEDESLPTLHLTLEHEGRIKDVFALHKDGKYREFWNAFQKLAQDRAVLNEIDEVKTTFGLRGRLYAIAYIAGSELTEKDIKPYLQHTWSTRICDLPGVSAQLTRLLDRGHDAKKMHILKGLLSDIKVKVPFRDDQPETVSKKWYGFDENDAQERTVFDVVIAIVKARPAYEKKDEESTKKLLRIVKIILGREEVTDDDEEQDESE